METEHWEQLSNVDAALCGSMNFWVLEVKENEAQRLSDSAPLEDAIFGFVTHLKFCVMEVA